MKLTTINAALVFVSGATRTQAYKQVPATKDGQEWGIEMIYENALDYDRTKRYAWAIYKKAFFVKTEDEMGHLFLALQLQWMYDHAQELQVEE